MANILFVSPDFFDYYKDKLIEYVTRVGSLDFE